MRRWVIFSGGLDSTCALAKALEDGDAEVVAVSTDYGQRHGIELDRARQIAREMGTAHRVLDLRGLLYGSALLGQGQVPEGHYAEEPMASTVVNGRNMLFASAVVALTDPGDEVWLGVHAGDHFVYPDCRPSFWEPYGQAVLSAYGVKIVTPYLNRTKAQIVAEGYALGAPLGLTWSCYRGQGEQCGRCGTCVERAEAFHLAGVPDPTTYEDADFWRSACKEADQ